MVMSASVCSKCIEDEYLKEIVDRDGERGKCSVCNEKRRVFRTEELGELLEPIIREHFSQGQEVRRFSEDDDKDWWEQEGDDLNWVVEEVLGQYFDFQNKIVNAVIDAEYVDPRDGDVPFFDRSANYVEKPISHYLKQTEWRNVLQELKHSRRFFSPTAGAFFSELFTGVDQLQYWDVTGKKKDSVVVSLPKGSKVFRARICDSVDALKAVYQNPFLNVGPPPPEKARAGRMNAEGVVVFYGATDPNTCIAEMRPPLGGDTAVITLETTKLLRLLDFTRLSKCLGELSYFQTDFREETERFKFLRHLGRLISRPIIPGNEADYLITQTMTEYLAHIHEKSFDGILFNSTQRKEGINVVIFPRTKESSLCLSFPLKYSDGSLQLFSTRSISYEHYEKRMRLEGDSVVPDYDWFDFSDE
jgi:hypothetical protein